MTNLEIGRIDMFQVPDGVRVMKWPVGWIPRTPPSVNYLNVEMTLDQMVEQLQSMDGWIVRKWASGARAWKGELRPIRTAHQIRKKREKYTRFPRPGMQLNCVDFAFDW